MSVVQKADGDLVGENGKRDHRRRVGKKNLIVKK